MVIELNPNDEMTYLNKGVIYIIWRDYIWLAGKIKGSYRNVW